MTERNISLPQQAEASASLERLLRSRLKGEVRFDRLARALYATDASIYEIVPLGVVFPKDVDDVVAVVQECRAASTPIIARGAGTGLTGGAVGYGLQLDLSRHMNRIARVDVEARTVEVEPGVVLDELNAQLAPHTLQFAPDVATSSRATIGGMIANNSCGAHSIVYGRTVDHVAQLSVVLADGQIRTFTDATQSDLEHRLAHIRDHNFDEIQRRFPKVMRSNGGYGLDRLGPPGTPASALKILCGSEGTLGIVVAAKLRLVPIPRRTGLTVLHFSTLLDALTATPLVLRHHPAAVELIDKLIIDAGRANPAIAPRTDFLRGDPAALLVVEFFGEDDESVRHSLDALCADPEIRKLAHAAVEVLEPTRQADVWKLRTSGLGLLMSKPGDAQPYAFVEDSAVDPARLRDYIARFASIMDREHVHAGYYAHASVGCIHVKPVLNLKNPDDIAKMGRIAAAVADLALEFGGAMTGEHGDGIVRSCWIERMYGPRIVSAFREVKTLFDPDALMNPHKIVDPWPMTEHLRYGSTFQSKTVKTHFDFSAHGGMPGLAGMCSGVGQCRQRLVGVMCPSYLATNDETHTTRARANALRLALSNRGLLQGLDDPALDEVMDLCLSCKACKTECPTGVDMAKLKAEFLAQRILARGASPRARLIAELPRRLNLASRLPRLVNLLAQSKIARAYMHRRFGLDSRIPPPRLTRTTFRAWFAAHAPRRNEHGVRGDVIYFVDTWTNHFTPEVGIAAVTLLERAGYRVHCPPTVCCGRPAISQGLLTDAKTAAEINVRRLLQFAPPHVPIVGTEPSCVFTLVDDYPQLLALPAARDLAARTMLVDAFLFRCLHEDPSALSFIRPPYSLMFHAHCHQKAITGASDTLALLRLAFGAQASEINSGCCGMAGAFGHETEHYDVARAVGQHRLFPAVRNRGHARIAVSGFSCREQIAHHTDARPRHVLEYLTDCLV